MKLIWNYVFLNTYTFTNKGYIFLFFLTKAQNGRMGDFNGEV